MARTLNASVTWNCWTPSHQPDTVVRAERAQLEAMGRAGDQGAQRLSREEGIAARWGGPAGAEDQALIFPIVSLAFLKSSQRTG